MSKTTRPSAVALEWWLRKQGKFEGASVRTRSVDGTEYELYEWVVEGIEKPTAAQLNNIIDQYEAAGGSYDENVIIIKEVSEDPREPLAGKAVLFLKNIGGKRTLCLRSHNAGGPPDIVEVVRED